MMNDKLEAFARKELKDMLAQCTAGQIHNFKRMYSHGSLTLDINTVVDSMPSEKLDWAMQQCQRTLDKTNKEIDNGT